MGRGDVGNLAVAVVAQRSLVKQMGVGEGKANKGKLRANPRARSNDPVCP